MLRFKVTDKDVGKRADIFTAEKLQKYTRSSLKALFASNKVKANGKIIGAGYKLRNGDDLEIDHSQLKSSPKKIYMPIIYEDTDVIVINKPPGVLTHSKGALNLEPTVASFIKPKLTDKTLMTNRAGIVHRLDRPTSGVIITTKHAKALRHLQKQFSARNVKKSYLAIVEGEPIPNQAIIDAPIGRNPRKPQTFKVGSFGKPAETMYKVLKKLELDGKSASLVEFQPKTGRTHQIRVHAAYIGHPLVGDHVYGHEAPNMYLHAQSLELTLPNSQRRVFTVEPPKDFQEVING
jgi:23S rRNA pseudouridine1911/1915/1917 synthase